MDVFLVVYDGGDARPYAAAFSTYALAEAFAKTRDGEVIDTAVDRHVDMIEDASEEDLAMAMYRVEWAIDIEASSPREAAEKAREKQQYPREGYCCGVFDVTEHDAGGEAVRVDLDGPEQQRECLSCGETTADVENETHQQWQCPCCGSWNDKSEEE